MDDEHRTGARIEALEIKLAELEYGQGQLDEAVRRQGEDLRRLTEAVRALGARLDAALGEPAAGAAPGSPGEPDGPLASPEVDPERPPHHSGPA